MTCVRMEFLPDRVYSIDDLYAKEVVKMFCLALMIKSINLLLINLQ